MLKGLSLRYAIVIASILLMAVALVLSIAGYFVLEGTNALRDELTESFSTVQTNRDLNVLRASGTYLGDRLFDPLYYLDVTALNEELARIDAWLSPASTLILDRNGRVVTDGTVENPGYGVRYAIPDGLIGGRPLIQRIGSDRVVYFSIERADRVLGYARILISNGGDRAVLESLQAKIEEAWQHFLDRFLTIALFSVLATLIVSLLIGLRLSKSLSRPLTEMGRVVAQYAAGNLEHKLPDVAEDELGHLARSLNQMASEQERARAELIRLANYDNLTRLPNRHLFYDRLRQAIARTRRGHHQVALFFLDLDHFKEINDALGHDVGDGLLREVAKRLMDVVRDSDTLARMGGDEFTLIVEGADDDSFLQAIAQKMIEALLPPFLISHRPLYITVSIGIAIYPRDADAVETLLKQADMAMYAAKGQGRGSFRFFTPELQEAAREQLAVENVPPPPIQPPRLPL